MPVKVKKMGGNILEDATNAGKRLGKEAFDVALPIIKEEAKKMLQEAIKKKKGEGLFAANPRGMGMFHTNISPAQVRTLKKGGAIQLNRDMLDEAGRYAMELKPEMHALLEKALSQGKGVRVSKTHMSALTDMKNGGNILTMVASQLAPMVAEKLLEYGLKKSGGDILEEKFSINDIGRTGKRLFGMGNKFSKKQLTKIIKDKNEVIGDLEETAYGKGLFAGGSYSNNTVIQTGSPYADPNSQAMSPFIGKNPYV